MDNQPAFKCTYSGCEKHFNRHDNLLQHLKVHKVRMNNMNDGTSSFPVEQADGSHIIYSGPQISSFHPHSARINMIVPPRFAYRDNSPETGPGFNSFATNLAVSSLRTELPN